MTVLRVFKKKIIFIVLVIVTLILISVCFKNDSNEISFSAVKSENFLENMSEVSSEYYSVEKIVLKIKGLNKERDVSGTIKLILSDVDELVAVKGHMYHVDLVDGYIGVLDGKLKNGMNVTIDVSYISKNENFTAITIGTIGNETISFLGEKSDKIQSLQSYSFNK